MKTEEKQLEKKYIYKGRILNLRNDTVTLPNGNTAYREVIEHNGGVCVAALDENGDILLVSQYRYPYMEDVLEIPAGKLEKGEEPSKCAVRELSEETGATAKHMEFLGKMYPSPGYTAEIIYIYAAWELTFSKQHLDSDEFLNVVRMPLEKAGEMVMSGEIVDGKTCIAVLKLLKKKGLI